MTPQYQNPNSSTFSPSSSPFPPLAFDKSNMIKPNTTPSIPPSSSFPTYPNLSDFTSNPLLSNSQQPSSSSSTSTTTTLSLSHAQSQSQSLSQSLSYPSIYNPTPQAHASPPGVTRFLNSSMQPSAPMDDIPDPPPLIPRLSEPSTLERRLEKRLVDELKMALSQVRRIGDEGFKLRNGITSTKDFNTDNGAALGSTREQDVVMRDETNSVKEPEEEEAIAEVLEYGEFDFRKRASVFNGNVISEANVLVRPTCARQVSRLIQFCTSHSLSLSVKSGGYGTSGWSVAGQVILDLSLISSISVSLPPTDTTSPVGSSISKSSSGNGNGRSSVISSDGNGRDRTRSDPSSKTTSSSSSSLTSNSSSSSGGGSGPNDNTSPRLLIGLKDVKWDHSNLDGPSHYTGKTVTGSAPEPIDPMGKVGQLKKRNAEMAEMGGNGMTVLSMDGSGSRSGIAVEEECVQMDDLPSRKMSRSKGKERVRERERDRMMVTSPANTESPTDSGGENGRSSSTGSGSGSGSSNGGNGNSGDVSARQRMLDGLGSLPSYGLGVSNASPPTMGSTEMNGNGMDGEIQSLSSMSSGMGGGNISSMMMGGPGGGGAFMNSFGGGNGFGGMGNQQYFANSMSLPPMQAYGGLPSTSSLGSDSTSHLGNSVVADTAATAESMTSIGSGSKAISGTGPSYALLTFGAGATGKEIDRVSNNSPWGPYFLPLAAFPVGSAVMMTGGFGFIGRLHGLSMDNLVEIEIVLADGRIVWLCGGEDDLGECLGVEMPDGSKGELTMDEVKDLWFGIRGAGTALGVATRYRAKAYPLPVVYSGNLIYPFNTLSTPSLLKHVRDCIKNAPRELYVNMILTAGPNELAGVVIIQICYAGREAEGLPFLQAIASWEGERCLFKDVVERSYLEQEESIANVLKGGAGRKWYIKSDLMTVMTDESIHKTCQHFKGVPDGCTWLFELGGGAMSDCKTSCLPMSHREALYTVAALHQCPLSTPEGDRRTIETAVNWIEEVIKPHSAGGPLPCFLNSSDEVALRGTFGPNYPRLQRIKSHFDPSHVFRHTLWPSADAIKSDQAQAQDSVSIHGTRTNLAQEEKIKLEREDAKKGMDEVVYDFEGRRDGGYGDARG